MTVDAVSLRLLYEAISTGWHAYTFAQGGTLYRLFSEMASQRGREAALAVHDAWMNSDLPRDQLNQAESALRGAFQIYSEQAEPGTVRRIVINQMIPAYLPNQTHKALLNAAATALLAAEVTHYAGNPAMSRTWLDRADSMYCRYRERADPDVDPRLNDWRLRRTREDLRRKFDQNCHEFEAAYNAALAR